MIKYWYHENFKTDPSKLHSILIAPDDSFILFMMRFIYSAMIRCVVLLLLQVLNIINPYHPQEQPLTGALAHNLQAVQQEL